MPRNGGARRSTNIARNSNGERRRGIGGSRRRSAGDRRMRKQSAGEGRRQQSTGDRRRNSDGRMLRTTSGRRVRKMPLQGGQTCCHIGVIKACHIVDLLIARATCSSMRTTWSSRLLGSHKSCRFAVVLSKSSV
jgi:hypothetical protein